MANDKYSQKNINIDDLLLDTHNPRVGETNSQEEKIKKIIRQQQNQQGNKIIRLARHIAKNGLSPSDLLLVIKDDNEKGKYRVIDGNRRATAIKLLLHPEFASGTSVEEIFLGLHSKYANKIRREIPCAIAASLEDTLEWRSVAHDDGLGGVQQEPWGAVAKARVKQSEGKPSSGILVLDHLLEGDFLDSEIIEKIDTDELGFTTFERVITRGSNRKKLGIRQENNNIVFEIDKNWTLKIMSKILTIIAKGQNNGENFSSREVETSQGAEAFVDKVINEIGEYKKEEPAGPDLPPEPKPEPTPPTPKPPSKRPRAKVHRRFLIPDTHDSPNFKFQKIEKLYDELKQRITTIHGELSVSVAFRALLEISLTHYCKENDINEVEIENPRTGKKKIIKIKTSIEHKALGAIDHMKKNEKAAADDLIMFRKLFNKENSIANELHIYTHNPDIMPTKTDLHEWWQKAERFFDALWKDLSNPPP